MWESLPPLPDEQGFGGAFVGSHQNALLVAGGANFPNKPPWEDGEKVWHDRVFVLEEKARDWIEAGRLETPLAYGAAVNLPEGVLLLGGSDTKGPRSDAVLLSWDPAAKELSRQDYPPLPEPKAFPVAGFVEGRVFVGTGKRGQEDASSSSSFWSIDPLSPAPNRVWRPVPNLPGPSRLKAMASVQSAGDRPEFLYVFGGQRVLDSPTEGARLQFLDDGWRFDPRAQTWEEISPLPRGLAAACAVPLGQSHILLFGGSAGKHLHLPLDKRPGFGRTVLSYHTITDRWTVEGEMLEGVVTAGAAAWAGGIAIPSGETRPGVRTPAVQMARLQRKQMGFGAVNYAVLLLYLGVLVGMGFYFARREKGTDDFFLAGKRIPWWAAGLSIYATQLSAITYLSSPAVSYSKDWLVYPGRITLFLMAPIVIFLYLPFFRRLNITTAYEYLERRFSLPVRLFGSLSFTVFQLGRMAVVVYLPALALSTITGMSVILCIVIMGVLSILYTVLGGMEAVVWTDALQTVVLLGGVVVSTGIVLCLEGGPGEVFRTALADGKLRMTRWTWSPTEMATWSMFLGSFALQFGPYTTDQAVIQRYLSTKDEKDAAKGIWTNGVLSIPFGFLFMALGTCLYVFFKERPELVNLGMQNDEVFPLFIVLQLPQGVSGLVIAGIFAASMSTLDSSMHSIATTLTTDWYRRFRPQAEDRRCLRLARFIVLLVGLFAMGIASFMASHDIKSLLFLFQKILGLISSGIVGVFILGIFTKRGNSVGALTGAGASLALLLWIRSATSIHFYLWPVIGIPTSALVGYAVSVLTPGHAKDARGLHWFGTE